MSGSIISHVSVGTNHFDKAVAFYDAVLTTLGISRMVETPEAVAYGRQYPEFWVVVPYNNKAASVGNGCHFAFIASCEDEVNAFYNAALSAGAVCDGKPGRRPEYGPEFYGCYVRDLDGHKIEATFWDESKSSEVK
jgi:catechol 2,3-dioxygenase-like lactoylglutathione lyase family enzyme